MTTVLKAEKREGTGKYANRALRAQGLTPCVVYGKAEETTAIAICTRELSRFVETGEPMVKLELGGEVKDVVIKEVQYNTFMTELVHADFNILHAGQKTTVTVPVEVKGTAAGAAVGGAVELEIHEIDVICLPKDIPHKITIDVRNLELNGIITVADLPHEGSIGYALPAHTAVVVCHMPKGEEPIATEGGSTEPEVIGAKKEEE